MSILGGKEIERAIARGDIEVDPYEPAHLNPVSLDLRLGKRFAVYLGAHIDEVELDCKTSSFCHEYDIPADGLRLHPGTLYLMHTVERVKTTRYVPVLDGKSSIGRLGVFVHVTAGFGDPGFDGQYTLEVLVTYPTRVYAGMRFCQIRFHTIEGEAKLYEGNYTGEASMGPVPSKIWKQFR
jgi:dCTP deaminase